MPLQARGSTPERRKYSLGARVKHNGWGNRASRWTRWCGFAQEPPEVPREGYFLCSLLGFCVLVALLFLNAKHTSAPVPSSCVVRTMRVSPKISVAGFSFKGYANRASEYLLCRCFRQEFDKFLGRYVLGFRTHRDGRYVRESVSWHTSITKFNFNLTSMAFVRPKFLNCKMTLASLPLRNFAVELEKPRLAKHPALSTSLRDASAISALFLAASAVILVAAVCSFKSLKVPRRNPSSD